MLPLVLAPAALAVPSQPPPQQSHSGPTPPASVRPPSGSVVAAAGEVIVANVPNYVWRHGCGPTAVGMVIGYYDRFCPQLVAGDASTQTAAVDQVIASQQTAAITTPQHYEDYSLPRDDSSATVLPDKSESPAGDEHAGNCIADFMRTSWSVDNSRYGSSWSNRIGPAFVSEVNLTAPGCAPSSTTYYMQTYSPALTWDLVTGEIDAGRPLVFLVDSSGDGYTDHFVPVIGYRETSGYPEYACWDTWYAPVRWARFRAMSSSYPWGVWGGFTLHMTVPVTPPTVTISAPTAASSWPSGSTQTVSWTADPAVSAGEFLVALVNQATSAWYVNKQVLPVADQTAYSTGVIAAVPAGPYKAAVYWRPTVGSGDWTATTKSAAFTVTPINITVPSAATVWPTQATCTVSWNVNPAMSAGEFRVSLIDQAAGTWYVNKQVLAVAGKTSYSSAVNTLVPPGSYKAAVYWRAVVGTGLWTATQKSAAFTIATLAIGAPSGASSWPRLSTQSVAWSVTPGLASGEFRVSLVSATNVWYVNKVVPVVPGQVPYGTGVLVSVPAGSYRAAVYWRPAGSATWVLAKKTAAFTVTG
jgi:hypothetical protein